MPQNFKVNAYTRNQPEAVLFPAPIVAKRAPTTADKNYAIGQSWIQPVDTFNVAVNGAWILTSIISNSATWESITGGAGVFTTLTVTGLSTLGALTQVGTANINASGSAVTTIGTGGTGAVNIGNATGNTAVTGNLTATGNITSSAGNLSATVGSVSAGTTVTAGTGLTVTAGDATLTNGNLVLSTAATKITLPGPVNIMTGAGAPANGLAVNVGDMYINTTAASAVTRLYIATAANTWTNVTCAA